MKLMFCALVGMFVWTNRKEFSDISQRKAKNNAITKTGIIEDASHGAVTSLNLRKKREPYFSAKDKKIIVGYLLVVILSGLWKDHKESDKAISKTTSTTNSVSNYYKGRRESKRTTPSGNLNTDDNPCLYATCTDHYGNDVDPFDSQFYNEFYGP